MSEISGKSKWPLAVLVVAALFLVIYVSDNSEPPRQSQSASAGSASRQSGDRLASDACAAAQHAVLASLRTPATAKFPDCVFGAHEYRIRADESRATIWVSGHVDAENAFGATLRSKFGVKLHHSGGELTPIDVVLAP